MKKSFKNKILIGKSVVLLGIIFSFSSSFFAPFPESSPFFFGGFGLILMGLAIIGSCPVESLT